MKKLFIITGDYSGDVHAGNVVQALRQLQPDIEIAAVGGPTLEALGVPLVSDQSGMGKLGLGSLMSIPYHLSLGHKVLRFLKKFQPDAVLLIDYGMFNLHMANQIRKAGLKNANLKTSIFYFIPPQVWVSRKNRIFKIKAAIDHVFCIFPFEEDLYKSYGVPVTHVGHPLVGQLPPPVDRSLFCQHHGLDPAKPIIGLFPGSRKLEIDSLLKPMIQSLPILLAKDANIQFVLAKAASLKQDYFREKLGKAVSETHLIIVENKNHALLSVADVVIVASGTVTLEAALYNTPMVMLYKLNPLVYQIALRMMYMTSSALPNILTDIQNPIVPELWQRNVNPNQISQAVIPLLNPHSDERQKQLAGFQRIQAQLQTGKSVAAFNVAETMLEIQAAKTLVLPLSNPPLKNDLLEASSE